MTTTTIAFTEFTKIARLSRRCTITEKIDGTNAQVEIVPAVDVPLLTADPSYFIATSPEGDVMLAGSRSRYIVPAADNAGFAGWVKAHAAELWALGHGRHFGEWWGSGIQRGYGLQKGEKRFSLFNTARWGDVPDRDPKYTAPRPACCSVVPTLGGGIFSTALVDEALAGLAANGSYAAPGFMKPEGVIVYHEAARIYFKKTIENDDEPKGARG